MEIREFVLANEKACLSNSTISWLSLAACGALATWWGRGRRRAASPAPPVYPGALPLIGHALLGLVDEPQIWKHMKDICHYSLENGGVTIVRFGVCPVYVLTDPDDCLTVAKACLDKPYVYSFAKDWLGNGLVTSNEKTWKVHRKLLNPAFNQQIINKSVDVFNDQSRRLVEQLRGQVARGFFDPEQCLLQNILETTCRTTLNMKPDENNMSCMDYIASTTRLLDIMLERFQKLWLHHSFVYNISSLKKEHDRHCKIIEDIVSTIIQNRRLKLHEMDAFNMTKEDATDNIKTLLDLLLLLAAEQGVLTDSDIMDHLNTFIVASYDTAGSTLVFTLVLLGSHQDVQERVYKELQQVLEDTADDNIDKHVLTKLVYLDAVLKESMRLYPAVPAVAREAHEDVKLKNYTMPAGSFSILCIYAINRHPMWGADAAQFRPERWLEPGGVPDHPNAFASFSMGRRNCIGKLYGLMSMKTTLAHLLRRYHVTADVTKLILKANPILKAVAGQDISLKLRT